MASSDELTGVQKAAVLLIALGPEKSAEIFKHLKEDEIEELTLEIANTRSISPQVKESVLNEFYQVCGYMSCNCVAVAPISVSYNACHQQINRNDWSFISKNLVL